MKSRELLARQLPRQGAAQKLRARNKQTALKGGSTILYNTQLYKRSPTLVGLNSSRPQIYA